jgi:hypothetical protein
VTGDGERPVLQSSVKFVYPLAVSKSNSADQNWKVS